MARDWVPFAKKMPGTKSGSPFTTHANPTVVMHTMECRCWPNWAALGSYAHFDYNPTTDEARQYISLNRSAYALASPGSPTSPNIDGGHVIQIELQGYAGQQWTNAERENIAAFLTKVCNEIGAPIKFLDKWDEPFGGNETYGSGGPRRLSWNEYKNFSGILGHQHTPFNDHWDPGKDGNAVAAIMLEGGVDDLPTPRDVWKHPITSDDEDAALVLVQSRNKARAAEDKAEKALKVSREVRDDVDRLVASMERRQEAFSNLSSGIPSWLSVILVVVAAVIGLLAGKISL